jgi:hypothetical protein
VWITVGHLLPSNCIRQHLLLNMAQQLLAHLASLYPLLLLVMAVLLLLLSSLFEQLMSKLEHTQTSSNFWTCS